MADDVRRADGAPRPRAVRRRRPRPRLLRRLPAWRSTTRSRCRVWPCSTASPSASTLARCDARFAEAWWHWFFFGPDREARRARDQCRSRRLVWELGRAHGAGRRTPISWRPCATPRRRARDGRGLSGRIPSTAPRTTRTGRPAGRSAARRSSGGRPATTWRHSTATSSRCGGPGRTICAAWRSSRGHHVAEEAPEQVAAALLEFFGSA